MRKEGHLNTIVGLTTPNLTHLSQNLHKLTILPMGTKMVQYKIYSQKDHQLPVTFFLLLKRESIIYRSTRQKQIPNKIIINSSVHCSDHHVTGDDLDDTHLPPADGV